MPFSLETELADQLVEQRYGDQLAALRSDLAEALAENENLTVRLALVTDQRDRLETLLTGLREATAPSPLPPFGELPSDADVVTLSQHKLDKLRGSGRTGLYVAPNGGPAA